MLYERDAKAPPEEAKLSEENVWLCANRDFVIKVILSRNRIMMNGGLFPANFVKFIDSEEIPNRNNKVVGYDVDLNLYEYDEIERKEVHEAKSEEHLKLYMIMLKDTSLPILILYQKFGGKVQKKSLSLGIKPCLVAKVFRSFSWNQTVPSISKWTSSEFLSHQRKMKYDPCGRGENGRSKENLCRWNSCTDEEEGSDELIEHLGLDHLRTQDHCFKWQGCYLRFQTFEELTGHFSEGHIGDGY
ncbi:hypothetical protein Glove_132g104 [Diversispora epigaea]|uniref:Uncharacterized protein n=1 Tax=Diversispora epigaea TaxID=1348612 RepID=A0A397IXS5_9GLOM|nr:hypothetical protein Glove_132g104 [Diversispora epigaea]